LTISGIIVTSVMFAVAVRYLLLI